MTDTTETRTAAQVRIDEIQDQLTKLGPRQHSTGGWTLAPVQRRINAQIEELEKQLSQAKAHRILEVREELEKLGPVPMTPEGMVPPSYRVRHAEKREALETELTELETDTAAKSTADRITQIHRELRPHRDMLKREWELTVMPQLKQDAETAIQRLEAELHELTGEANQISAIADN